MLYTIVHGGYREGSFETVGIDGFHTRDRGYDLVSVTLLRVEDIRKLRRYSMQVLAAFRVMTPITIGFPSYPGH